ncbi:2-amino-4-hydroxy-6-hydroxymethyldihydropteridine diphosphokinase [Mangrovitalea sediminis]|uniref:2-amino-4-hydroxy-6- hydroxymethyldihydropteridine diphosphokinase n=1 Tax=Mangrovitalea sediminis TaxID=1982043 RepID=UPI000BE5DC8F|nr:2-amino-4-hydroxy-6-hydroxymethyldihydropteridine diphosphokinase [Mangrovitalea sediminis]
MTSNVAYIGLGSNLDRPLDQLRKAIVSLSSLPQCRLLGQSRFYRSRAVGPADQPDYVNAAVRLETGLSPIALLDHLQHIENQQGRVRHIRWGARTLDLDMLLFGDCTMTTPRLTLPHPEMANRDFVLQPLLDLTPDLSLPDGRRISELRRQCPDNHLVPLEDA